MVQQVRPMGVWEVDPTWIGCALEQLRAPTPSRAIALRVASRTCQSSNLTEGNEENRKNKMEPNAVEFYNLLKFVGTLLVCRCTLNTRTTAAPHPTTAPGRQQDNVAER